MIYKLINRKVKWKKYLFKIIIFHTISNDLYSFLLFYKQPHYKKYFDNKIDCKRKRRVKLKTISF